MDATMPMFMLKRTGRAAEFAGLEEAGAAEPELAGAVADVAAEETTLTVVPKPVGVDIGVGRRVDKETKLVAAEVTLCAEAEERVVLAVVPVATEPIVKGADWARTCSELLMGTSTMVYD